MSCSNCPTAKAKVHVRERFEIALGQTIQSAIVNDAMIAGSMAQRKHSAGRKRIQQEHQARCFDPGVSYGVFVRGTNRS